MRSLSGQYPRGKYDSKLAALEEAIRRAGCELAQLRLDEVRPALDMPEATPGLFPIAHHVREMVPSLRRLAGQQSAGLLDHWAQVILSIHRDEPLARDPNLAGAVIGRAEIRPPTRGFMTTNPVWCALWPTYWDENSPEAAVYRELQAQLLAAWIVLDRRGEASEKGHWWTAAGRMLRRIHQAGEDSDAWCVVDLANVVEDPRQLCRRLELYREGEAGPGPGDPLQWEAGTFGQLVSDAHSLGFRIIDEPVAHGGGGGGGGRRRNRMIDAMTPDHSGYWHFLPDDQDVATWGTSWYSAHGRKPGKEIADGLHGQGQDPGEYSVYDTADVDIASLREFDDSEDGSPRELPPLASLLAGARARGRRITMEVQQFRVELTRIRLGELRNILCVLDQVFVDASSSWSISSDERDRIKETTLLAAISIITGVAPIRVRNVLLVKNVGELTKYYSLAYNPEYRVWMRPYYPPKRHALQGASRHHALETWPRVVYEDVLGVGDKLALQARALTKKNEILFKRNLRVYKSRWDKRVKPLLQRAGVSGRWQRLESMAAVLPNWLGWQSESDQLPLRLLFGIDDPASAAQQYYTSWQRAELAARYHAHLGELWEKIGDRFRGSDADSLFSYNAPQIAIDENWVGNDRMPAVGSVAALVAELRRRIQRALRSGADRLSIHNDLVAYVGLGLALVTGARAVRTPIPSLYAIHRRSGTIGLQEKDQINGTHARLVALPDTIIKQTDAYLEHIERLYAEKPDLPVTLRAPATKHRDRSTFNSASYQLQLKQTLFFLKKSGARTVATEFTGRSLKEHCDAILPGHWPVDNAGRHLLRGFLVQEKCPATMINTHLGHWSYGEAPWTGASAMDPYRYRQEIRPYLDRLLNVLGYCVIRGR